MNGFPADIANRVFHEPKEVFEASSFISSISGFFAESELFEFPVVLTSHGPEISWYVPVDGLESFGGVGGPIISIV